VVYEPEIESIDGIWWSECQIPPPKHKCFPQTFGWTSNRFMYVERCMCGAIKLDQKGRWMDRNFRLLGRL
jgi:hypothetical protein